MFLFSHLTAQARRNLCCLTRSVSKSLTALLNQRYPGYTTAEEIGNVARFDMTIPPEISRLVGQKYKLMVTISKKWKSNTNENLSFQVNRIEETYKPELPPLVIRAAAESGGASSSGSGSVIQLPPVILPSLPVASPPVSATLSPTAKMSPSTPAKGSTSHKRGVRRSLFGTPSKDKTTLAGSNGPSTGGVSDPPTEAVMEEATNVIAEKDDLKGPFLLPKVEPRNKSSNCPCRV